ncbi:MAG: flippase-like domain-containing protein [Chloroflexi bacterium]|nr:flippase-like domain-containing protein [Chloroflexota bacterium]MDA8189558.1 lysylphosphatidylglycerol synthase transmembrane domain-containing protein [Dehalococcoidales bacterium]
MKLQLSASGWVLSRFPRRLVTFLAGGIFLWIIYSSWRDISSFNWKIDLSWLLLSVVMLQLAFLTGALGWNIILRSMGIDLPFATVLRIWLTSQLGKYLPAGTVFYIAGRVALCARVGIGTSLAATSLLLEMVFLILGGTGFFLLTLPGWWQQANTIVVLLAVLVVLTCAAFLWQPVFEYVMEKAHNLVGADFGGVSLQPKMVVLAALYYVAQWAILGYAFFVLLGALYPVVPSQAPAVAGTFAISCVIGYLVILAPGGIGVREAGLVSLLAGFFPLPVAMAIAVMSRMWYSVCEALCALGASMGVDLPEPQSRVRRP